MDAPRPLRLDDAACRAIACRYLDELLAGAVGVHCPGPAVCWDPTHHLQGHAHVGEVELVVIAPRDIAHEPLLVREEDWDLIRRAPREERSGLLDRCAIRSPRRLGQLLGGG